MLEIISLIIFLVSLIGIGVILYGKIPKLVKLPETAPPINWRNLLKTIKDSIPLEKLSLEMLLQKVLSKVRVLTLKTDHKTSGWLQGLRAKSQKKRFKDDDYWQDIKKGMK